MAYDSNASSRILDTLNLAQRRAVCSEAPTVAILAGPGSGKTHTLTSRVVWLIDAVGYKPEDVIVATFTVKAAREMKERIGRALGNGRENNIVLGTFHSVARRYLAAYGRHIGLDQKFGIADDGDSRAALNRICKRLNLGIDPYMARAWISKEKARGRDQDAQTKRHGRAREVSKELEMCYREYQQHLKRSNLLDYDDLLVSCVELLREYPKCVSNVQAVLIDEYQDTNGIQYELMKLFAQRHRRITVVGDPDQSIYGWRSAEIRNLHRLLHDFPGTDEVSLEENYRSSQSILDISLRVIQQDAKRYQKVLKPIHDRGTRPTLRRLKTSAAEGEWIVSEIRRIVMMSGNMMSHDDVAILLRSASLSRHIEAALGKAGIPYKMIGGFKFYERSEIKIILDYLRILHQPDNNDALARIINVPKRGVGEATIKSLIEEAEKSSQSLWTLLLKHCRGNRLAKTNIRKIAEQKISSGLIHVLLSLHEKIQKRPDGPNGTPFGLVDIIDTLLTRLDFEKFLHDTYPEDYEQRWANVQEFLSLAKDFSKDLNQGLEEALPGIEGVEQIKDDDVLSRFLANVALASDVKTSGDEQVAKPMVTISTIHAAKGLEWPVVFVPAAYNGSIPHMRSEDGDEERRLLYVAMTRAKALLYLSCPLYGSHNSGEKLELSPFVSPIARSFEKTGPLFEKNRLETIGRILGREPPTQDSIYNSLPGMVSPNDDLFPEDPENPYREREDEGWDEDRRPKRQRLRGPAASFAAAEEPGWQRGYSTTMEQKSEFTVGTFSGFVSAGAHQAAITAANGPEPEPRPDGPKGAKHHQPKQQPHAGQGTLLGFLKRDPKHLARSATVPAATPARKPSKNRAPFSRTASGPPAAGYTSHSGPQLPEIDPQLSGHKLRPSKPMTHQPTPPQPRLGRQYAQFSSSPPRPPTRRDDQETPGDDQGEAAGGGAENRPPHSAAAAAAAKAARPAASLHNTTMNMARTLGGFKRPPGLAARDGADALRKLRKPFKPLTINRS